MPRSSGLIKRTQAAVMAIDVQERLWPAMTAKEALLQNMVRLLKGAGILGVPVIATEQYPAGLGTTVPAVSATVAGPAPFIKLTFSACGVDDLLSSLRERGVSDVVLCGIEAHVCVMQTCLDLLEEEFRVFVVADAVASRTPENHRLGLERMRNAGAVIVSTEMVLFEMVERAGTSEFKKILELVK